MECEARSGAWSTSLLLWRLFDFIFSEAEGAYRSRIVDRTRLCHLLRNRGLYVLLVFRRCLFHSKIQFSAECMLLGRIAIHGCGGSFLGPLVVQLRRQWKRGTPPVL